MKEDHPHYKELLEKLAELEHEQWMKWASVIMRYEKLTQDRVNRWNSLMVPYSQLTESSKEHDREWARKIIPIIADECIQIFKIATEAIFGLKS